MNIRKRDFKDMAVNADEKSVSMDFKKFYLKI